MGRLPLRVCKKCGLEAYEDIHLVNFVTSIGSSYNKKNICRVCDNDRKRKTYNKKKVHTEYLRKCLYCGVEAHTIEDLEEFVNHDSAKYGKRNMCLSCKKKIDSSDERLENEKQRRYGVSVEEYNYLMSTSHCCEICGSEKELVYDHDHSISGVEAFRGVLCRACNGAIGILGDTLESLNKAVSYLRKYERGKQK